MIRSKYMLGDKVSHSIVKTVYSGHPSITVQEVVTSIPPLQCSKISMDRDTVQISMLE